SSHLPSTHLSTKDALQAASRGRSSLGFSSSAILSSNTALGGFNSFKINHRCRSCIDGFVGAEVARLTATSRQEAVKHAGAVSA
uniref:Uncharacterized protein n=1 Tax=Pseudonaja textilis TaxID=8673 RepID=A0A670Z4L3_PSETE